MPIDVLVVGCGVFGLSTVYHLAQRGYRVKCFDKHPRPSLDSAAYDINKIVRTEYEAQLCTELAIEALDAWRQPINSASENFLRAVYNDLQRCGQGKEALLLNGGSEIARHLPCLAEVKGIATWKALWNGQAGWAHSSKAMQKLASETVKLGVEFVSGSDGTMVGIETAGGRITGIKMASKGVYGGSRYIISTGAGTTQLFPHLSHQLRPTCWSLAHLKLSDEEVVINGKLPKRTGESGIATRFSIPRYASEHRKDGIPEESSRDIHRLIDELLPQFSRRPLQGARLCWDLETPDQHFLIDKHPDFPTGELLLATGGSAHGFKFLPIIGNGREGDRTEESVELETEGGET